jgi:tRNA 2-thiouridine synthesizing protein A
MENKKLDVRGTKCPVPIVKAKKMIDTMQAGDVLEVHATDPGSVKDFQAFSKQTGNELLEHAQSNGEFVFFMRKK